MTMMWVVTRLGVEVAHLYLDRRGRLLLHAGGRRGAPHGDGGRGDELAWCGVCFSGAAIYLRGLGIVVTAGWRRWVDGDEEKEGKEEVVEERT